MVGEREWTNVHGSKDTDKCSHIPVLMGRGRPGERLKEQRSTEEEEEEERDERSPQMMAEKGEKCLKLGYLQLCNESTVFGKSAMPGFQ